MSIGWEPFYTSFKTPNLIVETIIVASVPKGVASTGIASLSASLGELEESTRPGVLHLLSKGLVPADLDVTDRATSHLHGLLEVALGELWNRVLTLVLHINILTSSLALLGPCDIDGNGLLDGDLDSALSDKAKIGTGEAVGLGSDVIEINIVSHRRLAELSLENAETALLIGKRNVDQRVKTAGTAKSGIKLLRPVGGTNDENILLGGHAIHFCKIVSTCQTITIGYHATYPSEVG